MTTLGDYTSDNELPGVGATVTYAGQQPDDENADYHDRDGLYSRVSRWWKQWREHHGMWLEEARESFAFNSLDQWSENDKNEMKAMNRVPIVFDRTNAVINFVCGLEINTRQDITYYARQEESSGPSDLLNSTAMWARSSCDAEEEESDQFRDMLICGMGFSDTHMDFEEEEDGRYAQERVDPFEMFWDASASKRNIVDAKFIGRIRKWDKNDVMDTWPDTEISGDAAPWDRMDDTQKEPHDATTAPWYKIDQGARDAPDRDKWSVCHIQWKEREDCVKTNDPFTGKPVTLTEAEFDKLTEKFHAVQSAFPPGMPRKAVRGFKTTRMVVWQAFLCGSTVLEVSKGAYDKGFTFGCMTGYRDRNKRVFFGLMRPMKDPQRWSNKWFSQILYILNAQAKGGMMLEADAIPDTINFEETWNDPAGYTILNSGAISGNKIKEKPVGTVSPAFESLQNQAIVGISASTGVNPESLGLSQEDNSGVLEYQRRQSAITVLAPFFDALRLYRRNQGKVLLYFIQNYVPDGTLIRVGGQINVQYVKLARQKTLGEYDVVVDESPSSPNQKERDWSVLVQILPMAAKLGIAIPPDVIEELPLNANLRQKWVQFLQQKMNQPPNPMMQAKVEESQTKADLNKAQTQKTLSEVADTINRNQADTKEADSRATLNYAQAADVRDTGHLAKFDTIHQAVMDHRDQRQEDTQNTATNAHARQVLGLDTLATHHTVRKDQATLGQAQQALDKPPAPQGNGNGS